MHNQLTCSERVAGSTTTLRRKMMFLTLLYFMSILSIISGIVGPFSLSTKIIKIILVCCITSLYYIKIGIFKNIFWNHCGLFCCAMFIKRSMFTYLTLNILNHLQYMYVQHHKLNLCQGKYIASHGKYSFNEITLDNFCTQQ